MTPAWVALVAGATLLVEPQAAPGGDGSESSPFSSLQAALVAARPGDVVLLGEGIHVGPALLDRPLTLRGRGHAVVVAQGADAAALHVSADVRIESLAVQGGRTGIEVATGGVARLVAVQLQGQPEVALDCGSATCALERVVLRASFSSAAGLRAQPGGVVAVQECSFTGPFRRAVDIEGARLTGSDLVVDGAGGGLQLLRATTELRHIELRAIRSTALFASGGKLTVSDWDVSGAEYGVLGRAGAEVVLRDGQTQAIRQAAVAVHGGRLSLRDHLHRGAVTDAVVALDGATSEVSDLIALRPGAVAIRARMGSLSLREVVADRPVEVGGGNGNLLHADDVELDARELLALQPGGPAVELLRGRAHVVDLAVRGGLAGLVAGYRSRAVVRGVELGGGVQVGVACTEEAEVDLAGLHMAKGSATEPWQLEGCTLRVARAAAPVTAPSRNPKAAPRRR